MIFLQYQILFNYRVRYKKMIIKKNFKLMIENFKAATSKILALI